MIRVLVVDDHTLVRAGLCRLLDVEEGVEVVGQTGSGREGVELAVELQPDVVILDYHLPDIDGLEATEQIVARAPKARILVLTMSASEEYAIRVIRAGAAGFIVKGADTDDLLRALRKVAQQGTYVSPDVQERMVARLGRASDAAPESGLSNREMQVLLRLARGAATREVAAELCLSLSTIETYRGRILEKLGLRNNSDLTRFAIRRGLIDLD